MVSLPIMASVPSFPSFLQIVFMRNICFHCIHLLARSALTLIASRSGNMWREVFQMKGGVLNILLKLQPSTGQTSLSFLSVDLLASLLTHSYIVFSFKGGLIAALANQAVYDCSSLIFDFESCCFYFRPEEGAVCLKGFSGICIHISLTKGSATHSLALPTSLDCSACSRVLVGFSWCHFQWWVQQCHHRVRLWRGKGIPSIWRNCHWSEGSCTGFKSHDVHYLLHLELSPKHCLLLFLLVTLCSCFCFCFLLSSLDKLFARCCVFWNTWCFKWEKKKKKDAVPYFLMSFSFLWHISAADAAVPFPDLWVVLLSLPWTAPPGTLGLSAVTCCSWRNQTVTFLKKPDLQKKCVIFCI